MANIVQTLAGDRSLQLGNEEIIRPMIFGDYWTEVVIGIRFAFGGGATITTPEFVFGVCSGSSGAWKPASVTFSAGQRIPQTGKSLTYTVGPPDYFACGINFCYAYKIGASATTGNVTLNNYNQYVAAAGGTPGAHIMRLIRTGVGISWDVMIWPNSAALIQSGQTLTDFLYNLEAIYYLGNPTHNSFLYGGPGVFVNNTNRYPLDNAFIYWSGTGGATAEIYDWCVLRMA